VGRVALDARAGFRPRFDSVRASRWVEGSLTVPLGNVLALGIGAGTGNRSTPYGTSRGNFGSIALRFSPAFLARSSNEPAIVPAATSFAIHRNTECEVVVHMRLPHARRVEISGDFNGWKALALEQVQLDEWEITLPLSKGTYRMNVRVDGEGWIAPPGAPEVKDEFNGVVGLVTVR
jgi:hypothetical protein